MRDAYPAYNIWVPDIDQRAGSEVHQLVTALQPGFNSSALLFANRATLGQAYQTEVIAANIAQAISDHGITQELFKEGINGCISQIFLEVQVQLKTQLLEFIHAEFFAQTAGTVSSHGTILKSDNARHSSSFAACAPASKTTGRPTARKKAPPATITATAPGLSWGIIANFIPTRDGTSLHVSRHFPLS
jgi:hypothetical protein